MLRDGVRDERDRDVDYPQDVGNEHEAPPSLPDRVKVSPAEENRNAGQAYNRVDSQEDVVEHLDVCGIHGRRRDTERERERETERVTERETQRELGEI